MGTSGPSRSLTGRLQLGLALWSLPPPQSKRRAQRERERERSESSCGGGRAEQHCGGRADARPFPCVNPGAAAGVVACLAGGKLFFARLTFGVMPRYEEPRGGGQTRLYVGRLSSRTRSRDLEDLFSKYGRVRDVDLKHDFAFVEFSDPRDADEAIRYLNGKDFEGSRLVVEFARRVRDRAQKSSNTAGPRGPGGAREYLGRGPPPGTGRCYNCGNDGHWARDCKAGDWRDKCYRCGQRGHIERNCRNSPRPFNRYERSRPSRSRSPGDRSRSRSPRRGRDSRSYSRSRSYSPRKADRSRSPVKEETRSRRLTRSRSRSLSPVPPRKEDLSRSRSRSPVGNGRSISRSPPPRREPSRSPSPRDRDISPRKEHSPEPEAENHSLMMRKDSPVREEMSRSPSVE